LPQAQQTTIQVLRDFVRQPGDFSVTSHVKIKIFSHAHVKKLKG
jgi:hypothetical protein